MSNPLPDVISCENCAASEGGITCHKEAPRFTSWLGTAIFPEILDNWCLSGCWKMDGMWLSWYEIRSHMNRTLANFGPTTEQVERWELD